MPRTLKSPSDSIENPSSDCHERFTVEVQEVKKTLAGFVRRLRAEYA